MADCIVICFSVFFRNNRFGCRSFIVGIVIINELIEFVGFGNVLV